MLFFNGIGAGQVLGSKKRGEEFSSLHVFQAIIRALCSFVDAVNEQSDVGCSWSFLF
ncbi:unnamed protein product [Brassica napus]|uniref:(rape) hypothetical protein n=1 Tax=Brassica napus TaxID=3708 RepID=A0A816IFH1_BRANA|nr:unnamed protein product [Brassica napus]